jgi:hypothetical protein
MQRVESDLYLVKQLLKKAGKLWTPADPGSVNAEMFSQNKAMPERAVPPKIS